MDFLASESRDLSAYDSGDYSTGDSWDFSAGVSGGLPKPPPPATTQAAARIPARAPALAPIMALVMTLAVVIAAVLAAVLASAAPAAAFEAEAREIMAGVYDRPDGEDRRSTMTLVLTNKAGRTRTRTVEAYSKDYGPDRRSLMVFVAPADVRDTAYLSWEHGDPGLEDDKWIWLPAMRRDRRINGKSRNESFMGTDFTYDDLGRRRPEKDEQRLMGEDVVDSRPVWIVECLPVDPDEGYTRRVVWVAKDLMMVVRAEYHDKDGLLKVYEATRIDSAGGFTSIGACEMRNVVTGHSTSFNSSGVEYDTGLPDDLFTVAAMRRGRL